MTLSTINGALDNIYQGDYANLNLFIPEKLYVHGLKSDGLSAGTVKSPANIKAILQYMAGNMDSDWKNIKGLDYDKVLYKLQQVGGISFSKIPLAREGASLTQQKQESSNPTLTLTWLLDREGDTLSFLDAWRDLLHSQYLYEEEDKISYRNMLRTRGVTKGMQGIDDSRCGIGEGTLQCKYVQIMQTGEILELGELMVTGLMPVDISGLDKVGPGLGASSKVAECTSSCIYAFGYVQFYHSGRKIFLK